MRTIISNIKSEIRMAVIVTIVGIVSLVAMEIVTSKTTAISYNIELWIDGCSILDFFFPLFVTLPFTWKLYFERKDGFINYVSIRTDKKKYIVNKIITGMLIVFLMVFVIYYMGLIMAEIFIEPECPVNDDILSGYIWGDLQVENPLVFGLVWCMWKGIVGAIICAFGYGIALLSDNVFVISIFPFLYCTIENFVTGTLGIEEYSLCTTYILNRLSPSVMNICNYYVGVISFIIIGSMVLAVWYMRKKQVENSEKYN